MFPGCHPCSCSPSLLRFDFEFARASPSSHSHALPVHALRQVIIIVIIVIIIIFFLNITEAGLEQSKAVVVVYRACEKKREFEGD